MPFITACVGKRLPHSLNMYYRKHYLCNLMTCANIVTVTHKNFGYLHSNNTSCTPNIHNSHLIKTSLRRIIIWLISTVKSWKLPTCQSRKLRLISRIEITKKSSEFWSIWFKKVFFKITFVLCGTQPTSYLNNLGQRVLKYKYWQTGILLSNP